MRVSTELKIWYRDLAVTIQCTGFPAQHPKGRVSQKCQAAILGLCKRREARESLELRVPRAPSGHSLWQEG